MGTSLPNADRDPAAWHDASAASQIPGNTALPQFGSRDVCLNDLTAEDLTGLTLGQYALGRKIGEGGMGAVFVARHIHLDKQFAIKFIAADVVGIAEAQARFDQEVLALGQFQHPNIVNAVDAGSFHDMKYLVTELAEGEDFDRLVERHGSIPPANASELIRQTALGLAYSHQLGFLHRDIKPSNLILDRSGIVKILDFGLVRNASINGRLTLNGHMLGTLDFIAPEQAQDASQADARSDLYSLGCTLLYLLSGQPPYADARYSSMAAKLKGHLFDRPDWLNRVPTNVPTKLVTLIERMTAKSPDNRIQTAQEVAEELTSFSAKADLSQLTGVATLAVSPAVNTPQFRDNFSPGKTRFTGFRRRTRLLMASTAIAAGSVFTYHLPHDVSVADNHPAAVVQKDPEAHLPPKIVSVQDEGVPVSRKYPIRSPQYHLRVW